MNLRNTILGFVVYATLLSLLGCNGNEQNGTAKIRDAKTIKQYGPEVKQHKESSSFENIYPKHGNDQKLSTLAADYLGRNMALLNFKLLSKEYKPDYIEYQFEVDELPLNLTGLKDIFSIEVKTDSKGKPEKVTIEFVKKNNPTIRSQHTMIVDFPALANSDNPKVTYGFDKKQSSAKKPLHIKKTKSSKFNFIGTENIYIIGAATPLRSQSLELFYDTKSKSYKFETEAAKDELNIDRSKGFDYKSDDPLFDDLKYCSIVNNIKTIQNKYIKSGGYYKIDGVSRLLSNVELLADFPLREMYKGEALMRHNGTSLSDGQSYVKLVMDDTKIGLLINVEGYITQYQQVIVDKEKGIIEKTVLIRS